MDANVKALIDGLNEDLANEFAATIMYTYNAATVTGLDRLTLKPFFEGEITDEAGHALYLADKIRILGGTPTTEAVRVEPLTDTKAMLEAALKAEEETIKRYTERREQAEKIGDIALVMKLEDMIADETGHKEELQRLLQDPRFK
ncbi:ferritin-like domain-containing protein [Numidum massiliense]|uniref:ferritin-like domain-containing protein n=1 Tax=Numidum massiliense TaxID=1522315 RepID=UPI0006D54156|nr:ferritin-like domain-containing protein [Numidum massiliense]